jgi:hypothetical protein
MTDPSRSNLHLAAETALTSVERARFLEHFDLTQTGPSVAAVLDVLAQDGRDSNQVIVEAIYDHHHRKVSEPGLLAIATRLAVHLDPQVSETHMLEKTWEVAASLVKRIRPLLGLSDSDMHAERAKRDKLELLAPLGFEDFEDDESPDMIWHKLIGAFDHRKVSLENIVSVAYYAGKNEGMEELRAKFRTLLGLAPLNHTHPREDDGQ